MTLESTHNWISGMRAEKTWRPADYPPLASLNSSDHGGAAGKVLSLTGGEYAALIAHLRERLAASERQLRDLLDELQRMQSERETPQRLNAAKAVNRWRPFQRRAHSHRDVGTPELANAGPCVPPQTTWDWGN